MAKDTNEALLKRLNDIIEGAWNHVTPGTPDYSYVEKVKRDLRAAINAPSLEQPTTASVTSNQ